MEIDRGYFYLTISGIFILGIALGFLSGDATNCMECVKKVKALPEVQVNYIYNCTIPENFSCSDCFPSFRREFTVSNFTTNCKGLAGNEVNQPLGCW